MKDRKFENGLLNTDHKVHSKAYSHVTIFGKINFENNKLADSKYHSLHLNYFIQEAEIQTKTSTSISIML